MIGLAVFDTKHSDLANASPASTKLLVVVLVLFLATYVGFVCLYRPLKHGLNVREQALTYTMEHVPRGCLTHSYVPVELHAGHTFQTGHLQEDSPGPLLQRHLATRKHRSRLDREVTLAIPATIRHAVPVTGPVCVRFLATRTLASLRPKDRLKPFSSRLFVRKHTSQLD